MTALRRAAVCSGIRMSSRKCDGSVCQPGGGEDISDENRTCVLFGQYTGKEGVITTTAPLYGKEVMPEERVLPGRLLSKLSITTCYLSKILVSTTWDCAYVAEKQPSLFYCLSIGAETTFKWIG